MKKGGFRRVLFKNCIPFMQSSKTGKNNLFVCVCDKAQNRGTQGCLGGTVSYASDFELMILQFMGPRPT